MMMVGGRGGGTAALWYFFVLDKSNYSRLPKMWLRFIINCHFVIRTCELTKWKRDYTDRRPTFPFRKSHPGRPINRYGFVIRPILHQTTDKDAWLIHPIRLSIMGLPQSTTPNSHMQQQWHDSGGKKTATWTRTIITIILLSNQRTRGEDKVTPPLILLSMFYGGWFSRKQW